METGLRERRHRMDRVDQVQARLVETTRGKIINNTGNIQIMVHKRDFFKKKKK